MSQYFVFDPNQKDDFKKIKIKIKEHELILETNSGIFSKDHLDIGTKVLLENINLDIEPKNIIDLGCGYGVISIYLKKIFPKSNVFSCDVNQKAIIQTQKNAILNRVSIDVRLSNFFEKFDNIKYDLVISNPPIRIGKEKLFNLYQEIDIKLNEGGYIYLVIGQKQGAKSHIKELTNIFDILEIVKSKGFYVIKGRKKWIFGMK